MIRNVKEWGISNRETPKEPGLYRDNLRKILNSSTANEHPNRLMTSEFDPYRDRILDMIDKHNLSAIRILEEIRKFGFDGRYIILKKYCAYIWKHRRITAVYRYKTDL